MKPIFSLILLFFIVIANAQKVKVKNNILSIDKTEVAQLSQDDDKVYTVSTLEGKEVFKFAYEVQDIHTIDGDKTFQFLRFYKPNDTTPYYADYDISGLKFSLSNQKTHVRHLVAKNGFLSNSGINSDKVNAFFSDPKPINPELQNQKKVYEEAYKVVEAFNLKIDGNKIYKVEDEPIFIGSYKVDINKDSKFRTIKVFDAKGFLTGTHQVSTILLFDGNKIKYTLTSRDNERNAERLIERMIIGGYVLGDMKAIKADILREQKVEAINEEKKTSANIYGKEAILYTQEGEEIDGVVTLEFEELESEKSGMASLKNYGGVVTLKTVKENGKFKYKDYKAKDNARFCLKDTEECYTGFPTLGFGGAKFYIDIKTEGELKLYESVLYSNSYIIKKDDAEKGLIISTSSLFKSDNSEKMFEKLYEYLSDCPTLKESLSGKSLDLDKEEDLKTILAVYNSCK